ncbi:MAG: FtsQ-type POTRA domain-containing protein [Lawsonibacter sp.]|nr:FtsQ-type POTRA domain-containing protein [Lawsonibacter sp.]
MAVRRNNHRRRRNRGRFGFLFKFLFIVALVIALTVGATVFFRVEAVVVSGNSRYTQEEVVAAAGVQLGENLFQRNKGQMSEQVLQKLPYVESLSIWRRLPNTIVIELTECDAAAQVATPRSSLEGAAQEPWLINTGGKLLEPAPVDSTVMMVSGLTPLMPQAGMPMEVPQEEQARRSALLSMLDALEQLEQLDRVASVEVRETQIHLRYMDRFQVKLPLNGDFLYQFRVLDKGVEETTRRHGEDSTGTMDLTQRDYELVYSPD